MKVLENTLICLVGAFGYGGLEILWRGYTHWTMLLLGGVCFLLLYRIVTRLRCALWRRWLLSAAVITGLECICGCIVNLALNWNVWDYSGEPGNLLGQVCPRFFALWTLLCIPCSLFALAIRKYLFGHRN